ncbi:cupin domain-containing protein [Micromonospora acroterricola]|uniref:Cupin domain-containing protein n=1 Tax=Micromonospora acroterricola TaxID=2202421 RepID=A0A317D121_9ACTN|nr:cupin domain-containing protein [Micromonospora acroterricola]PWR06275.1 cupin domain-containing protein [Micromonospora acroterricola]
MRSITVRGRNAGIAAGLLAVATLTAAAACSTSSQPAHAGGPTTASASASARPAESLKPLLQQALPDVKGKTFTSAVVELPPNASAAPHRHGRAFVYAYVLEGTVRSKLDDKAVTTYHQGENWVEQPGTDHVLTENASQTEPAKLLVVFVSNTGDKLKVNDAKP